MKKITLFIALMVVTVLTYAQSNQNEIDLMQAAMGMQKQDVVAQFVQPTDVQKDAFWKLYDEYEVTRKLNGQKRIELFEQYAKQYSTLTNEQAEAWMKEVIKLQTSTDKLIVTYYDKIKKATSPIVATQFYQIENFILAAVRAELLNEIPFVNNPK